MTQRSFTVSFDGATLADANQYAQELEHIARKLDDEVQVRREKPSPTTMDLGSVLTIVISSGAALALARGLADWMRLRRTAKITIRNQHGEIIAAGLSSSDAALLAERGLDGWSKGIKKE